MAFAPALCNPHNMSPAPLRSLHFRPAKVEFKNAQSASPSTSSPLPPPSSVPLRTGESRICSIAIENSTSRDVPLSRRQAIWQTIYGGGGVLACCAALDASPAAAAATAAVDTKPRPKFYDLDGSGGVKALDIRMGTGSIPQIGDKVAIHYYARLAAKQGWRFDSSYDHKDQSGAPEPYLFVIGDGTVIAGLDSAVRTMKEGGVRRVVIPPSQGYQNTVQGPIPPNFSDRQRLYTTIFNPTRLANGEGSTLGILVFDIEFLGIRPT